MAKGTTYSGKGKFPTMTKWVFGFGGGKADGSAKMKDLLGGKGANLAEMASLGSAGPAGLYHHHGGLLVLLQDTAKTYPAELQGPGRSRAGRIGQPDGPQVRRCKSNPLLVSVRSGARASMPGMMDTVLNLGLNDETARAIAAAAGR
jgi:pyruvate,orthophosphate dikinase